MKNIVVSFFVFLVIFIIVRQIQPEGIIFFQGLALGIIVAVIQCVIASQRFRTPIAIATKDAAFCFLLIYSFVFTIPTTVDRAYSVKMLAHIGDDPTGLNAHEIQQWFTSDFLERGGVQKRLDEQTKIGAIAQDGGRFHLTQLGSLLDNTFKLARRIFACELRKEPS
ncbi:MAG: hypothetical protein V4568_12355 [Pseudomonadota bacterium]